MFRATRLREQTSALLKAVCIMRLRERSPEQFLKPPTQEPQSLRQLFDQVM